MRPLFNVPGCGSFALIMSIISGNPVGARVVQNLFKDGILSKIEAERLSSFTNNSGPLFIIGAVAVGMLNMPNLGLILMASHIIGSITVGVIFRFYKRGESEKLTKGLYINSLKQTFLCSNNQKISIGEILNQSIQSSISVLLSIGGFITLFSVIISLLVKTQILGCIGNMFFLFMSPFNISKEITMAILNGFFEITIGTNALSQLLNTTSLQKLVCISILLGWSGLSIHSQILSILEPLEINLKPFLFGKVLHAGFSGLYTYIILNIWPLKACKVSNIARAPKVFLNYKFDLFALLTTSCKVCTVCIILFYIIYSFYNEKKKRAG